MQSQKETIILGSQKSKYLDVNLLESRMIVGVLTTQLHLNGVTSLKEKRSIIKSLIGRLKSRFNISIAEVDHNESKQSSVVAVAMVSNDTSFIDQQFDAIINFMQKDGRFYLGKIEREMF